MSIFASQFNTVSPYNPVGLDTGTPQVGLNLPKSKTPSEQNPTPVKVPASNLPADEAQASAAASQTANASQNAVVSALNAASNVAQQQRTYSKLMAMSAQDTAGGNPATIKVPAAIPAKTAASPGLWGDITGGLDTARHDTASAFDTTRHAVAAGVNDFGKMIQTSGPELQAPGPSPVSVPGRQGIRVNSIKLNPGNPSVDVEAPSYSALPRGLNAGAAIGPSNTRLAIEAGTYDPYQAMISQPSYQAMPRGWSAADRAANFTSMTGSEPGGAGWSAVTNPVQFGSVGSDAANGLPRGTQAGGGWESDLGTFFRDLGQEGE